MGISIGTIGLAYCAVSLKTSEVSDRSEDQLVALAMVLNVLRCKAGRDPNRQCAVKSRTCCLSPAVTVMIPESHAAETYGLR